MRRRGRIFIAIALCIGNVVFANDGSFRGSGSHLVPINDSSISVKKEILKFTRVNEKYVAVDVYYEFVNEGKKKELIIGFEAKSSYGDADNKPKNGEHPYMSNFTVDVNNQKLNYKVAIVENEAYNKNGVINALSVKQTEGLFDEGYADFYYVYHFTCIMNNGVNIIKHTYIQEMSSSVVDDYSIDYVLTAANRWKGGVIEDFTLQIDMGEAQRISIRKSFFQDTKNWFVLGRGEILEKTMTDFLEADWTTILMDSGTVVFKRLRFEPNADFHLASFRAWAFPLKYDAGSWSLPANFNIGRLYPEAVDHFSKKVLKNYPFALRGYIFKDVKLQRYFEEQSWYMKDVNYQATLLSLSHKEQEWVQAHSTSKE